MVQQDLQLKYDQLGAAAVLVPDGRAEGSLGVADLHVWRVPESGHAARAIELQVGHLPPVRGDVTQEVPQLGGKLQR
eukprot:823160-Lingulodinium_polyedra.AAC.1